ncbi:hypothetical protein TPHA_0B03210 [Tetrapisispora phaffii CBS 4417]|uniref:L-type lectin-like domain-containing protein n=1 Tax=Tetrapisispora phaffii (strain ATCC 24235 / CBS 4417 / NBRC 1672 / NRRL Y-8282 / UCD 70-5) TaxID=1071381 RepID=G8BPR2_TETPH|nr:hypothetical protein TPHA_0B03210 [Tetrapisispora phaffii CBS 4417]CCE61993.1 hypothetical protein TPHA_0B03210 [Tetrapisispora phaffii CBS 4417]
MQGAKNKFVQFIGIASIFLIFQLITRHLNPLEARSISGYRSYNEDLTKDNYNTDFNLKNNQRKSSIVRVNNPDASLSIPFLDKINNYWHIAGNTEIRNANYIRLSNNDIPNSYGSIMSNSIGDNKINDFETILSFRLKSTNNVNSKKHNYKSKRAENNYNEGLVFMISPENGFIKANLHSSYSKKQYELNTNGIISNNHELMGFPSNLPGLALVIDMHSDQASDEKYAAPFFDAFVLTNPSHHKYDLEHDGDSDNIVWLNKNTQKHIKLKNSIMDGTLVELRLIYLESISFLKVDIRYPNEGKFWIELFQTNHPIYLPKNPKTQERYIGVSALTKNKPSSNIEILNIETNEFHYRDDLNKQESDEETSFDFAKEIQLFLSQEFGERIEIEKDDFIKLQMRKSQPYLNAHDKENKMKNTYHNSNNTNESGMIKASIILILKIAFFTIMIIALYFISVYARVILKHRKKIYGNHGTGLPLYK